MTGRPKTPKHVPVKQCGLDAYALGPLNSQKKMNRAEILDTAKTLITGDRHDQHGEAHQNFARISALWSIILNADVDAHQVALCMAALKISRACSNPSLDDSFVDGCGYLALAGELVK